ncbi:MAG: hypothetical protein MJ252_07545 [archaeon]|nr:hypothetical protein [archaeon]
MLLIVYFLKIQLKEGKNIAKTNDNLGRLFYEFLLFYGFHFDCNKCIVDTEETPETEGLYLELYVYNIINIIIATASK